MPNVVLVENENSRVEVTNCNDMNRYRKGTRVFDLLALELWYLQVVKKIDRPHRSSFGGKGMDESNLKSLTLFFILFRSGILSRRISEKTLNP